MTIASRRANLKSIMRTELPVSVSKGAIESIIGLNETNYELNLDSDSRLLTLENNETIYQVFSYVGTNPSGQAPVYQESSIFDIYSDGLVDAIAVKADANQNPIEEFVVDSAGAQITVTSLIDNLDNTANFTLSGTPTENACIIYFLKIKDEFKTNIPEGNIIPPAINIKLSPSNTLLVAKSGGDFASIKDAIDSITDSSTTNRYTIEVAPGTYIEDNPIQFQEFISLKSIGVHSVVINPLNANTDLFIGERFGHITGVIFDGVTGASNYAVNHPSSGDMFIEDCVVKDCSNGLLLNHSDGTMEIVNLTVNTVLATSGKIIHITAGRSSLNNINVRPSATIDTLIEIDGVNSLSEIRHVSSLSPNLTTAFRFINGCRVSGAANDIVFAYDGLVIYGSDTIVSMDVLKMFNLQNDGFRIDNTGTGIELSMFATTISGCVNYNVNVLNVNTTVSGNGFSELNKFNIVEGAKFYAYILDISEDDEGLNILGELHVGSVLNPAESVFGEGDSYTNGMLVYTYDGSIYTDVSVAAKTASGSTFTFPNTNIGTAIYIAPVISKGGDMVQHYGIKTKLSSAVNLGAGNIVAEYWNGSSWVEMIVMEAESSGIYYPKAKNIFQTVGSNQIRYNSEVQNGDWVKNDPISPVVGVTYYWVRYRIESAITQAPVFEQWKLHSNRFEINGDGWAEYFGKARPQGQLNLNLSFGRAFEGSMQSQTLYVSEDIGVGFTTNKFTATTDKLGVNGFLPFDLDTSSPIKLQWTGHANLTGTYEWTIRWAWLKDGDSITYAEPGIIVNSNSVIISKAAILNQKVTFEALLDISEMISRRENDFGDEIWVSIQPTALPGNFSLASSQALYTKWSEGGHI